MQNNQEAIVSNDEISILVALLACVIALVSAFYARKSRDISQQANNIAVHNNLRPSRLAVYNVLKEYSRYCSSYRTLQCINAVNGTRDLVERIGTLKSEIDNYGPLNMPEIESKIEEFQNMGWKFQRVLDRLSVFDAESNSEEYFNLEDQVHEITGWFSSENKTLILLFKQYLINA
jgi:hypothetical protein